MAFYKQGLRFGLFDKVKFVSNIAMGGPPGQTEKDHPEGVVAGVHANYHFSLPSPLNKQFVERYHKRWKEYPSFESEGAYTAVYLLKAAIEKANKLVGRLAGRRSDHHHAGGPHHRVAGRLHPYPAE